MIAKFKEGITVPFSITQKDTFSKFIYYSLAAIIFKN